MSEPIRMCLGCRGRGPKPALTRLAWDAAAGRVVLDPRQVAPGRGAYLHPACVEKALRGPQLGRALRRPVDPGQVRELLAG